MKSVNYEVKCLACSAEVGQLVYGKFVQRPGPNASITRGGGTMRCSHCGGSLFLEPISGSSLMVDQAEPAALLAASAARRQNFVTTRLGTCRETP